MTAAPSPIASPNDLDAFWMPFTANRAFKQRPRMMLARAKGDALLDAGRPAR